MQPPFITVHAKRTGEDLEGTINHKVPKKEGLTACNQYESGSKEGTIQLILSVTEVNQDGIDVLVWKMT
jgi:hypothetical protein